MTTNDSKRSVQAERLAKQEQASLQADIAYRLDPEVAFKAVNANLTETAYRLWIYLCSVFPQGSQTEEMPTQKDLAIRLGVSSQSLLKAASQLNESGLWKFKINQCDQVERRIRDRLLGDLGGLTEVATPVGRIDLLTATEVIEVKGFKDWKAALGQVMAYSGFYPEHQKRIHLFSEKPITSDSIPHILEICSTLGVLVSFEEIQEVHENV